MTRTLFGTDIPDPTAPGVIRIEEGKRYLTRDYRRVGPMTFLPGATNWSTCYGGTVVWDHNGVATEYYADDMGAGESAVPLSDLIAELTAEVEQQLRDANTMWSYPSASMLPVWPKPQEPIKISFSAKAEEPTDWSVPRDDSVDEYREIRTPVPPVIAIEDGKLVVKLTYGNMTLVAPLGDGAWFFHQLVEKLVDPALRAYWPAAREPGAPND